MYYKDDTITAISTPIGVGGIGIIRISGNNAENIAKKIFKPKNHVKSFKNFRLYLGYIIDPKSNIPVDEVLLSIMRAPSSYTKEDVVEINSHSGYIILSNILQVILQRGARLAEPGEFTLRAFLNGRIDLTQAEAIIDLINAKSSTSLKLATDQLTGGFKKQIEKINREVTNMIVEIEASIDFSNEKSTTISNARLINYINKKILPPIKEIVDSYNQRKLLYEGINAAIIGRVNVGKSSILNRLLQEERAIVTPIPGTTRDIIEGVINIEGIPVKFIDTAGLRKVKGKIEEKGINLTKTQIKKADLILLVVDYSKPLNQYDLNLLKEVKEKSAILIINKTDMPVKLDNKKIDSLFASLPKVKVSALTGDGFINLNRVIFSKIMENKKNINNNSLIPNLRHKVILDNAINFLKKASINLKYNIPLEIVAEDIYQVKDVLNEITGKNINDDILTNIFNRFCVGK